MKQVVLHCQDTYKATDDPEKRAWQLSWLHPDPGEPRHLMKISIPWLCPT